MPSDAGWGRGPGSCDVTLLALLALLANAFAVGRQLGRMRRNNGK